jgi:hypothetical protein
LTFLDAFPQIKLQIKEPGLNRQSYTKMLYALRCLRILQFDINPLSKKKILNKANENCYRVKILTIAQG